MAAAKEQEDIGIGGVANSSGIAVTNDNILDVQSDLPVLEPLCFPEFHNSNGNFSIPLFCLLCDEMFKDVGMEKSNALLHHLLVKHQLVIADVDLIADFKSYIHYWKRRFQDTPITDFCSVININSRADDIGPKLQYNLLCDGLPEDKQLREQLQIKKLQGILQLQQHEREDSQFSRDCLFCNLHFEGNRSVLFQHMVDNHGFNVGLPDNLVYVNDLLDKLKEKLNNFQCLFCEKTFKDRATLRDHMRKKQHKKVNPKNKEFDKYYLINYLEVGKNWHDILDEDDSEINQKAKDESWEDWQEESIPIHCLFCEITSPITQDLLTHMKESHNFDFLEIKKNQELNFYEEVKIVNYIRRQIYNCKCIFCKKKFVSNEILLRHLNEMCHFKLPERKTSWDQPRYFFPTFENDGFLCGLPDDEDEDYDYCEDIGEGGANEIRGDENEHANNSNSEFYDNSSNRNIIGDILFGNFGDKNDDVSNDRFREKSHYSGKTDHERKAINENNENTDGNICEKNSDEKCNFSNELVSNETRGNIDTDHVDHVGDKTSDIYDKIDCSKLCDKDGEEIQDGIVFDYDTINHNEYFGSNAKDDESCDKTHIGE